MTDSDHSPQPARTLFICVAYLLLAVGLAAWLYWNGRPRPVVDLVTSRVQCLSYSPPSDQPVYAQPVTLERVRQDLKLLAPYTDCVRTYSVDNGLHHVPAVARELGLKVLLGAWIGKDATHNLLELERVVAIANAYPDVVNSVIVGNEVLLRGEQPEVVLREYIRSVRSRVSVPVTYADVWEFWMRHREIAQDVSFVTVHMLPYWEDHPIAVENAVSHITHVFDIVRQAFPKHRIMIGEAGWPSEGRQRAGAVPSRLNQARFVREFAVAADHHNFEYNLIEAFDQPWKRALEGTVGGEWGILDTSGQVKWPFSGPVRNMPLWYVPLLAGFAGLLLGAIYGVRRYVHRSRPAMVVLSAAGFCAGACVVLQWWMLGAANRNAREWFGSVLWMVSGWAVFICATVLLADWLAHPERILKIPSMRNVLANQGFARVANAGTQRVLGIARLVFLFCLSYMCVLLTLDPRYRDIPLLIIMLPTIALAICAWVSQRRSIEPQDRAAEEVVLACWLLIASVWIAIGEGLQNTRAIVWCGLCALFGGSVLWIEWRSRERQRAEQQADARELNPI